MKDNNARLLRADRIFLAEDACDLDAFRGLVERTVDPADYPFARDVVSNVPIYDGDAVRSAAASPESRREMMAEWVEAMNGGPGIIVFRKAFADLLPIEAANASTGTIRPAATISPNPAQTTASGTRWKSFASPTRKPSPHITATPSSLSSARLGWGRSIRSPRN